MSALAATIIGWALVLAYALGSLALVDSSGWYASLRHPSWQPPDWVFGLLWPFHYAMIALAFWVLPKDQTEGQRLWLIAGFAVAAVAGLTWAWLFYRKRRLLVSSFAILASALVTVPWLAAIVPLSPWLGLVLLPYQVWLFIAFGLAYSTAKLN